MMGADLFCGAGGMALGARWAGISVDWAIDNDSNALNTYLKNHAPRLAPGPMSIESVGKPPKLQRAGGLVLFGGPPCQGFSTSNQRTRTFENRNNWLVQEFIRMTALVRPDWVVFENVRGITETEGGFFVEWLEEEMFGLGYDVSAGILNAQDFGVPQRRSRFFLVGSPRGSSFSLPKARVRQVVTVWDAIHDLPPLENGASIDELPYAGPASSRYARWIRGRRSKARNHLVSRNAKFVIERYRYVPPGGNWEDIPRGLMGNYKDAARCHTGIYRRLDANKPSVVLGNYRKNMLIHPTQDRGLSVREAARLQSFPDWYRFNGSIGFQQQQVANAVPPLLAKAVFSKIARSA